MKKRKVGRPVEKNPLTHHLAVRITKKTWRELKTLAKSNNIQPNVFVRNLVLSAIDDNKWPN